MLNNSYELEPRQLSVAILFVNLGAYHLARLRGALGACREVGWSLAGLQITDDELDHRWGHVSNENLPPIVTLIESSENSGTTRKAAFGAQSGAALVHWLDAARPDAVFLPGWSLHVSQAGLRWCLDNGAVPVLMSESKEDDAERRWWIEKIKSFVVTNFAAALVGGSPHRAYLERLGFDKRAISIGYDVVDNEYFVRNADKARADAASERQRLGLPEQYFLASGRFIKKKNLVRLLDAYAKYRASSVTPWSLILLGDGEQREFIRTHIANLGLEGFVQLPGFRSYADLPSYYGLANAFVHASTTEQWGLVVNEAMASGTPVLVSDACGCADDLVLPHVNGFLFDPLDTSSMAASLQRISDLTQNERSAMGKAARETIGNWTPDTFGRAVLNSVDIGRTRLLRHPSTFRKLALSILAKRLGTAGSE